MAVGAETDVDDFREVGAGAVLPTNGRRADALSEDDELAAEWRGRWDEF